MRLPFLLLPLLVSIAAFGPESSAQKQWKDFLVKPSANTYGPLSAGIRKCVVTKCHDADIAGSGDNFANLYKLLDLAETGNHYAMEIAFQIRPLYAKAASPSEAIYRSLGFSATREPTFFLELIRKYHVSTGVLENFVLQTSVESVDNLRAQREEWTRRVQALSRVREQRLLQLRDKAISLIQHQINESFTYPDNPPGK